MASHPGFQSCYKNYKWGSTWNRLKVCIQSGQLFWNAGFQAAWATLAQHMGMCWPIMNVVSLIYMTMG